MALFVAQSYGEKLNETSQNLKPGGLNQLISGYPSHGHVIDSSEAELLFEHVRAADKLEDSFGYFIRQKERLLWDRKEMPLIEFLSVAAKKEKIGGHANEKQRRVGKKLVGVASNSTSEKLPTDERVRQEPKKPGSTKKPKTKEIHRTNRSATK